MVFCGTALGLSVLMLSVEHTWGANGIYSITSSYPVARGRCPLRPKHWCFILGIEGMYTLLFLVLSGEKSGFKNSLAVWDGV